MQKSLVNKAFVCIILILFIFMSIGPSKGVTFQDEKLIINEMVNPGISNCKEFIQQDYINNLTINVITDKTIYKRFEPINITISVTNNGDEDVTVTFPNCNLLADFDVSYQALYYRDSYGKILFPMVIDVVIPSGESIELLKGIWYQFSNIGLSLPFPPGKYIIRGWMAFDPWPSPPIPPFGYSKPFNISSKIHSIAITIYPEKYIFKTSMRYGRYAK